MLPGESHRSHAIDGLRGLAASMVVLHHLGASGWGDALTARGQRALGFVVGSVASSGVELFFVLSAVVLARPYLRGSRPMDLRVYSKRRIERLFPPYLFAWLFAGFCVYVTTAFPSSFSSRASIATFSLSSWLLQLGIVYFGEHFSWAWWSLTVECLFYVLIPLLIPLLRRLPVTLTAGLCLLGAAVLLAVIIPERGDTVDPVLGHFNWLIVYAPCFMAGLVMSRQDLPKSVALGLIALGIVFLVVSFELPRINRHIGYGLIYAGIVSRALDSGAWLSRQLGRWHLVWLGERSYSLFLTHCTVIMLVFHTTSHLMPARGLAWLLVTRGISLPLALLIAMLLFSGVERRFARGLVTADAFWPWRSEPRGKVLIGELAA